MSPRTADRRRLAVLLAGSTAALLGIAAAQAPPPRPPAAAPLRQAPVFDGGRAYEHLRQIVSFGPRPAGSAALARTRQYIIQQLAAVGVAAVEQPFDAKTPIGPVRMANVVATIPGARKDRIALAGHYDTKLFREFRFVGANDGGSSAAFLLEMARLLKGRRNTFTIEILFFDGEEATLRDWTGTDHTYGSQYYVDAGRKAGTLATLRALILVDMIGDRSLQIRREEHSTAWLTDLIWASARRLGHGRTFLGESAGRIDDDHLPFLEAGVASVDVIDLDYAAWHTANDTLDQVSARSLEIVGNVLLDAWGHIEARLSAAGRGN